MKQRMRVALGLVAAGLAVVAATGCSGGGSSADGPGIPATPSSPTPAAGTTIVEKNYAFSPADVTISVGDTVTFKNEDSVDHDIKIGDQDLGTQAPGQDVTWTAAKDGVFPLSCTIHPTMTGQLTVGAGGGSPAPSGATSSGTTPPAEGSGSGY